VSLQHEGWISGNPPERNRLETPAVGVMPTAGVSVNICRWLRSRSRRTCDYVTDTLHVRSLSLRNVPVAVACSYGIWGIIFCLKIKLMPQPRIQLSVCTMAVLLFWTELANIACSGFFSVTFTFWSHATLTSVALLTRKANSQTQNFCQLCVALSLHEARPTYSTARVGGEAWHVNANKPR
jgi:hypothetical protein